MNRIAVAIIISLHLIACSSTEKSESTQIERMDKFHPSSELTEEEVNSKKSVARETHATIGDLHVNLSYHSPGARGRMIWGGLVPFDEVWVAGAHMATNIEFSHDVVLKGNPLHAGKYALFMVPSQEKWQVIINSNWEQHLTDEYDSDLDLFRIEVSPIQSEESKERLEYSIYSNQNQDAVLVFEWEKIRIELPFKKS